MSIKETRPNYRPANCCANCKWGVLFAVLDHWDVCCNVEREAVPVIPGQNPFNDWDSRKLLAIFDSFIVRREVDETGVCDLWEKAPPVPEIKP